MTANALPRLPRARVEEAVRIALAEDLGDAGDLTSAAVLPEGARACAQIVAREAGCVAGLDLVAAAFHALDPAIDVTRHASDGAAVSPGQILVDIEGAARAILSAERVALNFLGHLSGIASATQSIVTAISNHKARICCTRKTTPGLRIFEKHAVRAGGGVNHRFGLYDGILIKDNHTAIAGGIGPAIEAALAHAGHMVKIEVEVDTLDQLKQALAYPIDAVLLDNMTPDQLSQAVKTIDGRVVSEASGRVTLKTAPAIAATGVDFISVGWVTHSAPCLDFGLDYTSDD